MLIKSTKNYFRSFSLFFLFSYLFSIDSLAQDETRSIEFQEFWQELYIYQSLTDKLRYEILFDNLYSSTNGFYDWFVEGRIVYNATSFLDLEALYRHENYIFRDSRIFEYRPMFRVSIKKNINIWSFRHRHKIEYRIFEIGKSQFRYRTDITIKPHINFTGLHINPYITEELFLSKHKFSRNRFYAGLEGRYGKIEPGAYLVMQSNLKNNNWTHFLAIGMAIGISLS